MMPANVMDTRIFEKPYGNSPIQGAGVSHRVNAEQFFAQSIASTKFFSDWEARINNPAPNSFRIRDYTVEPTKRGVNVWPQNAMLPLFFRSLRTARVFCKRFDVMVDF